MSESEFRRLLEAIGYVRTDVARVEETVRAIQADNVRGEEVHKDHEARLRSLERVRWLIVGAGMVLGGGAATFVQQLFS